MTPFTFWYHKCSVSNAMCIFNFSKDGFNRYMSQLPRRETDALQLGHLKQLKGAFARSSTFLLYGKGHFGKTLRGQFVGWISTLILVGRGERHEGNSSNLPSKVYKDIFLYKLVSCTTNKYPIIDPQKDEYYSRNIYKQESFSKLRILNLMSATPKHTHIHTFSL